MTAPTSTTTIANCTKLPPCTLGNLSVVGSNHELHTWNRFTTYRFKRTIFVHRKDYSSNMTISKFHLSNKDTTTFYVLPAFFLTQEPSSFHRLTSPFPRDDKRTKKFINCRWKYTSSQKVFF